METKVLFNEYVAEHYDVLKKIAAKEVSKKICLDYFEDIFHDTLIKCIKQFENKPMEQNEILAYFTRAIQVNVIRETKYAYNSLKTDGVEIEEWDGDLTEMNISRIDYQNILYDIQKTFSVEWKEVFQLWTEGLTIKEINEKINIKNSRYITDKIKIWLKENYKDFFKK
jgi:hypothetical protein